MSEYQYVVDTLRAAKTVFVAQDKDGIGLAIDPNDALGLIDSLQQQVKELQEGNRTAVESREIAVRKARETCITSNQHYAKVVELMDQLAERDRTIARQSAALETATDALNSIINGEWSETIDDQFLEVWTTRRINPSQIADEALLEINRELEALGE